jgi:ribosomal subunit interface protein
MNINIKATGIELTSAISDYVYKKISSVQKYLSNKGTTVSVQVEVGKTTKHHKSGDVFRAEVHMNGGGVDLYAVEEAEDLYTAIDLVEAEISREIVKTKGRHIRLLRQGQRALKYMVKGITDTTTAGFRRIKLFRKNPKS